MLRTRTQALGTPQYAPPCRCPDDKGHRECGHDEPSGDVYALGV